MNDFAPLTPGGRNARFEAGGDIRKDERDPRPFVRSSFDAPTPPARHPTLGVPVDTYLYVDERSAPSLFVQRFEFRDATRKKGKRKIFIQWSLRQGADRPEWIDEGFPDDEQLPLYNLPEIKASAPDALIVLVEGEKKVDAARVIFGDSAVVTTAAMGAGSFLSTDATPLAGHPILVLPDNDAAGQSYVRTVTGALHKLGCAIHVVDVAELVKIDGGLRGVTHDPVGWDCGDAVLEWTDLAALRAKAMELAKPYEDGDCTDYTTVPEGPEAQEKIRSELRERIGALNGMDENGIRAIVADAVKAKLSGLVVETLIGLLAKKLGVNLTSARKFWKEIEGEIKAEEAALEEQKREALSRKEREATARKEARKLEEESAATRKRLELSCREISNDPKLLDRLTKTARKAGVIGEDESIRSAYIAASSRFNRRKGICLLRRGAPAGGKNFITDKVLLFIPDEDVVRVSSGSPLSLVYYGGGDENALKHKIVYVAEAAILAERNGVESVLTIMLRLLISEGRIDHQVVVTAPNALATTAHIRRNGPVVVLITSARNNIEEELLTRLMTSDADESQEQTENVIEAALTDEDGEGDKETLRTEIGQWLDYQRWISLEAPYDVSIPYRPTILQAIRTQRQVAKDWGEKPKFKLRIRRDIHGFLTAIRTSAILHKAQRDKDEKGRIALPHSVAREIIGMVTAVTAKWTKQKKAEIRDAQAVMRRYDAMARRDKPVTQKDAAYAEMEAAYMMASANKTLPANPRQIFYAARPSVQEATDQTLSSKYFTQTLLPNFMADNPELAADWDIVWDDRGHFREPHTGHEIGLGTLSVRNYIGDVCDPEINPVGIAATSVSTLGPAGRYGAVLFIEKEGFTPIIERAGIPERFDIAPMSTKGMSVTAGRMLVEELCGRLGLPLLVMHDFDISGFSIKQTLTTSNRRYTFGHKIVPIDLGLRLADVERLGLADERVAIEQDQGALARRLRINGATPAEIDFLLRGRRVELNAMASDVFVQFVEDKLDEHGVAKVVPELSTLASTYAAFQRGARARRALEADLARLNGAIIETPADLEQRVRDHLAAHPEETWDAAIRAVGEADEAA